MEENKENSRDWLTQLAELTESIDNTFISGHCKIIVELPEEKFRKLQTNFREIDKFNNEIVISISDIDFTFVLKKQQIVYTIFFYQYPVFLNVHTDTFFVQYPCL